MAGQQVTGVCMAFTNCDEKVDDFNEWYSGVQLPGFVATKCYFTASRYENSNTEGGEGKYLAFYETDWEDPVGALAEALERRRGGQPTYYHPPQLKGVYTGAYKYVGPEKQMTRAPSAMEETRGLLTVFTVATDPARVADFQKWYDTIHIPDVVETPGVIAGHRFVGTDEGDPNRKYATVYEIAEADVEGVYAKVRETLGSKPKDHFIDYMKLTYMGFYKRIFTMGPP